MLEISSAPSLRGMLGKAGSQASPQPRLSLLRGAQTLRAPRSSRPARLRICTIDITAYLIPGPLISLQSSGHPALRLPAPFGRRNYTELQALNRGKSTRGSGWGWVCRGRSSL